MNYAGTGIVDTRQFTFSDFPIEIIQEPVPVHPSPEEVKAQMAIDGSDVDRIQKEQRAEHPDWKWELWKIEPHAPTHPQAGTVYEWLWEIFPNETAAKSYLKTMKRVEGKITKRKWEIRERKDKGKSEPYIQTCCVLCGHHKGRKSFHETCPRLGELLFKKGTKSAKVLMDETAGGHPCMFWISKEADRFGPCPEKNSMGTCMHGAYSCPHKTEEARAAVSCTYPIQPPHYAGDSPIEKKPRTKRSRSLA